MRIVFTFAIPTEVKMGLSCLINKTLAIPQTVETVL
jgi:hypothetical protein